MRKLWLGVVLHSQDAELQWGRNFIVAETDARRSGNKLFHQASMGPQLYRCGNNACGCAVRGRHHASMGPQLYRCGNQAPCRPRGTLPWRFNGAATLSLRKHGYGPGSWSGSQRFNGAATLSLRKHAIVRSFTTCVNMLQWGRNFIVAETWRLAVDCRGRVHASMGPQLYRCGNLALKYDKHQTLFKLQWGRNFIVAETSCQVFMLRCDIQASMGPQLYRCGNPDTPGRHGQVPAGFNGAATLSLRKRAQDTRGAGKVGGASMGPQLYRCGNSTRTR